jgi:GTPase SAR1 family protein
VKTYLDGVSDEALSASEKRELTSELDREKTFRIMACGATGHGKSALLNGIVGRQIFKISGETSNVNEYTEHLGNSSIVVLDTPGFDDTRNKEREYLQYVRAKCKKVDTLLYCVSISGNRLTATTMNQLSSTVSKLKKVLSKEIWKSCVVALTFANHVLSRLKNDPEIGDDNVKIRVIFNSIVDNWKSEIQNMFSAANIDNYKEIAIVTTGVPKKPKLLPDDEKPWLSTLWNTIYNKSPANGKVVLFHFNAERFIDADVSSAKHLTNPLHEQPIEIDESFKGKLWDAIKRNHTAAFGLGGTAGVTGATVGATIDALAIDIPSFGSAAGVGLVLGGLIGGAVGGGIGVGAGAATGEHVRNKKESRQSTETETQF